MPLETYRVLVLSAVWLLPLVAGASEAQSTQNPASPVTTLEEFTKARDQGEQAQSFEDKARYWRNALSWQSDDVEWLRLATRFAGSLREEWNNTHSQGQPPRLDHPYYRESEALYRQIVERFDHMAFYDKDGADSFGNDSLLVPRAASYGLEDYPRLLSMMQDFYDRRVKDWLAEPMPVKQTEGQSFLFEGRAKRITYEQRVADWLERRTRACEGQVFSHQEIDLIDGAVKNYAYRCRNHNDLYDSVPGLAELGTRFTAPAILAAIHKYVEIESPPFPRIPVQPGKIIELTIHGDLLKQADGPSKVDLDTGKVVTNPLQWSSRVQQTAWMRRGGLDLEVDYHWDQLMNVITFDLELIEVPQSLWNEAPASWEQLLAAEIKNGALEQAFRGDDQMQYTIRKGAPFPVTFAFRTREGGTGLLQVTNMKEVREHVREYDIRYRLDTPGKLEP